VDEAFYLKRPDLMTAGRTLFGARPPRGQEMEDHYFGAIPERVLSYMMDVERQLYRLGVPIKTRHNEVAPGQYEIAPIFEDGNIAADHQQLVMLTLQRTARRYGLVCLLHEKPFAGVNGSGKHCNFSMATDTGINLLEPGDSPHANLLFLFFCTAVVRAVHRHQDLLRVSVASAGNDHRLGANEAPPAIMSVFLGEQLTGVLDQFQKGTPQETQKEDMMGLGTPVIPAMPRHTADRNRTSPFAFTGNKFEFRAVGASQSVSWPTTVFTTIVAEAIDELATALEKELKGKKATKKAIELAVTKVVGDTIRQVRPIVFNGDNYSKQWHEEAEKRGLLNLRSSVEALERLVSEKNIELFSKYAVLSENKLKSRQEIYTEQYIKTINIEASTTEWIAHTMVLPAAIRHLSALAQTVERGEDIGLDFAGTKEMASELNDGINEMRRALQALHKQRAAEEKAKNHARHMHEKVVPAMNAIREAADYLERRVANDLWPMPTYREMLFVK
jgi:glutamine synthetase